jgi:hypothetical protein
VGKPHSTAPVTPLKPLPEGDLAFHGQCGPAPCATLVDGAAESENCGPGHPVPATGRRGILSHQSAVVVDDHLEQAKGLEPRPPPRVTILAAS